MIVQDFLDKQEKNPEIIRDFITLCLKTKSNILSNYLLDKDLDKAINQLHGLRFAQKKKFDNRTFVNIAKETLKSYVNNRE